MQVEAAAPLVETRSPATVVDNQRVVELPLNGRQTLDGGNHNDPLNNAPMPFPFPRP